ncbi:MAG: lysine--tRNA ligase [Candidatus Omnitrophica bacterium]|nr:lysine--tRNA ligase [Candidatus Omnitrophota bacterium]
MELEDIINQRVNKIKSLRDKGVDPYPRKFSYSSNIGEVLADFQEAKTVSLAGRLVAKRGHGKAGFSNIQDQTGKIQLYIKEDDIGKEKFDFFKDLDIGDFIGVKGELFKTHTGEITVKIDDVQILSKAIKPLPEKWHGLKDIEIRYRKRYLDLVANKEVKEIFQARSKIVSFIRKFLDDKGYLEVETPMLQPIPGGAAGRPFKSFHNEFDMDVYLRIAPELYLKRLLVGGFDRVYEINRSFRNEGVSTRHNPEFTMLEVYTAYADYEDVMKLTEDLVSSLVMSIKGTTKIDYQGKTIDWAPPWERRSFAKVVKDMFDINPDDEAKVMVEKLKSKRTHIDIKDKLTRSQVMKIVEDMLQEEAILKPLFFIDYFSSLSPLSKKKKDNPLLAERFELFVAGMEIANAYSELNDPQEQSLRLKEEIDARDNPEIKKIDEDFIEALEYGMPPAGGLGIGIDRLVMLLTDQPSIKDVILFPLLKQKEGQE